MSPLRLVIIAILFYIAYRLLFGKKKNKKQATWKKGQKQEDLQVSDVLVEDPVCHSLVPKQQAINLQHHGTTFYFCSEECCKQFVNEKGENT